DLDEARRQARRTAVHALRFGPDGTTGFLAELVPISAAPESWPWSALPSAPAVNGRRSRRPWTPVELAEIAESYGEHVQAGDTSPLPALAEATGLSTKTVKRALTEARRRGLLTKATGRGRPSGRLTARGRAVLERARRTGAEVEQ